MNPVTAPREPVAAPVPPAAYDTATLVERYAHMAHSFDPRPVDHALRALDVLIAGTALVVLSPVVALVALAVLTTGRPVLYRGTRVGQGGRVFTMYKFRTLSADAEGRIGDYYGAELTELTAQEQTWVGRVIRALHLDELPQLFNVVCGDMSLVGPRPIRETFFESLVVEIPAYWQRLVVRPGVTGFAQLRLSREMTWGEKLAHDFEYVADRSVHLYLHVLAATARTVIVRLFTGRPQA